MLIDEDDKIFGSSPKSKFFDIVYNANRNLVEFEIDKLLNRYVAMEMMLEDVHRERDVDNFAFDNQREIEERKNDVFIGFVGDVLSNNE